MVSDLEEVIYVPTLGDDLIRGTFDTAYPPFSTICFKSKEEALEFIENCRTRSPSSIYKLVEYKVVK